MKITHLINTFFLFVAYGYGQVTTNAYLAAAWNDAEVQSIDERLTYLDTQPYKLSILRRTEFRTENNQLDPERQDYALRFNPSNPWEIKNNNNYFESYKRSLELRRNLVLKKALLLRYYTIIDWLYIQELKQSKERESQLVQDQIQVLEYQLNSDFFDGDDYAKLKLEDLEKMVEYEELLFDIEEQSNRIITKNANISRVEDIAWEKEDFIGIDQIKIVVDSMFATKDSILFSPLEYRENRIELANQELNLEKSNINIGFLQTEYQPYRETQDRKPWSISLGVTIPITNPNKADMTKRKLSVMEAQYDLEETKIDLLTDQITLRTQLDRLLKNYQDLESKVKEISNSNLGSTLALMDKNNPSVILKFNYNLLKLEIVLVRQKSKIYRTYIDLLGSYDLLQQHPITNFLSPYLISIE